MAVPARSGWPPDRRSLANVRLIPDYHARPKLHTGEHHSPREDRGAVADTGQP
jgi:hypothetical protein